MIVQFGARTLYQQVPLPVSHLVKSLCLPSCFFFSHLLSQSLFLFSAESLGLQSLLTLYPHHLHSPLGDDLPEVALQFDDTVETAPEPLTGDVATAVSLETHHASSHETEIPSKLTSSPSGLKPVETSSHLQIK